MATICNACKKEILNADYMECIHCKESFDLPCLGMSKRVYENISVVCKANWCCPTCEASRPKRDNTQTPTRTQIDNLNETFTTDAGLKNVNTVSVVEIQH